MIVISYGISNAIASESIVISLIYFDSGDAMVLRTAFTTFGGLLIGVLFFKENISKWIVLAFILALVGLLFIWQPNAIFSSSITDSNSISWQAFLFTLIAAIFRVLAKSIMKQSGNIKIHWMAMLMIQYLISSLVATIVLVILICYYYISIGEGFLDHIFFNFFNDTAMTSLTKEIIVLIFIFDGCLLLGIDTFNIMGYQAGYIGVLSIVGNCDILLTYLFQYWWLGIKEDYLVYIGAVIVVLSVSITMWDTINRVLNNELNDNNDNVNNQIEYEPIDSQTYRYSVSSHATSSSSVEFLGFGKTV